ncbi:hypothetical protein [uncultured Paraglaciecola sp.]|uniref:hypothetical protein n=1 Tax=uncultured Paraglaciecola sp. TaxID=1765024 RepID=UPI0030D845EF|tara:strand:- start:5529 stop:6737 length:1209 start_codon:yes stop_codon:yes gene_type:complete
MKIAFFVFVIYGFMSLFSSVVAAVNENTINFDPEKIVLNSSIGYFDNYHPRLSNGISAAAISVGINGQLLSIHESAWLQATYSAAHTQFNLDENELALEDKFNQYNIGLLSRFFVGNKWYLDLQGIHLNEEYLLGSNIAKFRPATMIGDSVTRNEIAASVVYGGSKKHSDNRDISRFLKFAFSHLDQDYEDNNPYSNLFDLTRDIAEIGLNFKLSEITQFETSFQFEKVDFVDELQLDSDVYRLLLGFEWQGTGQTHLKLLVGGYKRVYQSTSDRQGFLVELDAEYTPLDYLTIVLKGSQTTTTGEIEGALDTLTKSASFAISYHYKEHIRLIVDAHMNRAQFEQIAEQQTSDDSALGIGSELLVNDRSTVSLKLQRESLEYELLDLDYVQNKVELSCRYAF